MPSKFKYDTMHLKDDKWYQQAQAIEATKDFAYTNLKHFKG